MLRLIRWSVIDTSNKTLFVIWFQTLEADSGRHLLLDSQQMHLFNELGGTNSKSALRLAGILQSSAVQKQAAFGTTTSVSASVF